ncbi:hypothetical protein TTHERM_001091282 (macronuclear) [Tetrahymena thermophila SB210]|uniref:Uncharacterized protein n=1 Tax=Tetrahymena thermophila (strain SB210) TaxID=312017 RepID=W7X5F1_TETTS|nr:hypothetical protein TTHERM_001091282 [Tetrahymena thermophila SB210]EWS71583.1 hypothetical protein TTHERM_001091282 [Tetrahymena thermophila SB210]|eukprot:XP_012655879.1 hypothetical protein TTHERM_001091282 [Tetrahymena thermophila SB210]
MILTFSNFKIIRDKNKQKLLQITKQNQFFCKRNKKQNKTFWVSQIYFETLQSQKHFNSQKSFKQAYKRCMLLIYQQYIFKKIQAKTKEFVVSVKLYQIFMQTAQLSKSIRQKRQKDRSLKRETSYLCINQNKKQ